MNNTDMLRDLASKYHTCGGNGCVACAAAASLDRRFVEKVREIAASTHRDRFMQPRSESALIIVEALEQAHIGIYGKPIGGE